MRQVPVPESLQVQEDKCTVRPLQRKETHGFKENTFSTTGRQEKGGFLNECLGSLKSETRRSP